MTTPQIGSYTPFSSAEMQDPYWWRKRQLFGGANPLTQFAFSPFAGGGGGGSGSGGSGFSGGGASAPAGGGAASFGGLSALDAFKAQSEALQPDPNVNPLFRLGGGGDAATGGPGSAPDTGTNNSAQGIADAVTGLSAVGMPGVTTAATVASTVANNSMVNDPVNQAVVAALEALGVPNTTNNNSLGPMGPASQSAVDNQAQNDQTNAAVAAMANVGMGGDTTGNPGVGSSPGPGVGSGAASGGMAGSPGSPEGGTAGDSGGTGGTGPGGGGPGPGGSSASGGPDGQSGGVGGAAGGAGGSGGAAGGCHIYTELLRQGLGTRRDLATIVLYHRRLQRAEDYAGYVRWSLPASRLMRRSAAFTRLVALPLARAYLARKRWRLGIVRTAPRGVFIEWVWDGINHLCGLRADAVPQGSAGESVR